LLTKLKKKDDDEVSSSPKQAPTSDPQAGKILKKDLKQVLGVQADFVINKGMKGGAKKQSESQRQKQ
jgi:hypothetical protein